MKKPPAKFQIGKNGLTESFIEVLRTAFANRTRITVVVLKNAGHEKENVKEIAEKIINSLGENYNYRIVGFTIFLRKSKEVKK
jgi:RNA-binding protein YhbY